MFIIFAAIVAVSVVLVAISRARQASWEAEDEAAIMAAQDAADTARFEAIMASYAKVEVAPATPTKEEAAEFAAKYF